MKNFLPPSRFLCSEIATVPSLARFVVSTSSEKKTVLVIQMTDGETDELQKNKQEIQILFADCQGTEE